MDEGFLTLRPSSVTCELWNGRGPISCEGFGQPLDCGLSAAVKIESNVCRPRQRCPETDFHTVWECPGDFLIEERLGSNRLADQAKA
eukprot:4412035-Pyramimonas_sp.AAC.1